MTLKFDVEEVGDGYDLHVNLPSGEMTIRATEGEMRRLLVDLLHDVGVEDGDSDE